MGAPRRCPARPSAHAPGLRARGRGRGRPPAPGLADGGRRRVIFVVYWVFSSSWQPLSDAIAVNALRARRGATSGSGSLTSLTFAIGTIGAGFLYDRTGYDASYVLLRRRGAVPDRPDRRASRARTSPGRTSRPIARRSRHRRRGPGASVRRTWPCGSPRGSALVLLAVGSSTSGSSRATRSSAFGSSSSAEAHRSWRCRPGSRRVRGDPVDAASPAGSPSAIGLRGLFVVGASLYGVAFASWAVVEFPALDPRQPVLTGFAFASVIVARRPDHRDAPPGGPPGDRPGALPDDRLRRRRDHRQRRRRPALQHGRPRPPSSASRRSSRSPPRSADGSSCRAGRAPFDRRPCDNPERGTPLDRPRGDGRRPRADAQRAAPRPPRSRRHLALPAPDPAGRRDRRRVARHRGPRLLDAAGHVRPAALHERPDAVPGPAARRVPEREPDRRLRADRRAPARRGPGGGSCSTSGPPRAS